MPTYLGPLAEARINIAIQHEARRYFQRILNGRKATIDAFEAEVKERREVLANLEQGLTRRKAGAAARQSDLRKWKRVPTQNSIGTRILSRSRELQADCNLNVNMVRL